MDKEMRISNKEYRPDARDETNIEYPREKCGKGLWECGIKGLGMRLHDGEV
jgi:hypothetical protein